MVLMIIIAQLYGVLQLALLGWAARSVRWGVLVIAVAAGLYAAAPAAIGIEWVMWHTWAAVSDQPLSETIGLGAYTLDPFVEEFVKVGLVTLLWWLLRPVRSWGRTDILLLCASVGSGFGLAEHLLRYSGDADRAVHAAGGGWLIPGSIFAALKVPGPSELLTSWLPSGVGTTTFLSGNAADLVNIHLAWSAVGGLGLALLLRPPETRRRPAQSAGALLIGWVGLDHALYNAQGGGGTARSLAEPFVAVREGIGFYVLVALAVAVALDRLTLRANAGPDLRLAGETPDAVGVSAVLSVATTRLPWSAFAVCGFVRARRVVLFGRLDADASQAVAVHRLRDALDDGSSPSGEELWSEVDAGMRARLKRPWAAAPTSRPWLLYAWLGLLALPTIYVVIGGQPVFGFVQGWFTFTVVFWLVVVAAVLAGAFTAWGLVTGLRAVPALVRGGITDPVATAGLLVLVRAGALFVTAIGLFGVVAGRRADDQLVASSHVLEAVGQSLLIIGLLLAVTALFATFPPSGMLVPVLAGAEVSGGAVATEAVAALLGKAAVGSLVGWLLTEAAGRGSSGSSGSGPRYEPSPKHGSSARGNVQKAPEDGQAALDRSVGLSENTPRRVGVDRANDEIVVFDETHPGQGIFHGHVRSWAQLSPKMRSVLQRAGLVDRRGTILP